MRTRRVRVRVRVRVWSARPKSGCPADGPRLAEALGTACGMIRRRERSLRRATAGRNLCHLVFDEARYSHGHEVATAPTALRSYLVRVRDRVRVRVRVGVGVGVRVRVTVRVRVRVRCQGR